MADKQVNKSSLKRLFKIFMSPGFWVILIILILLAIPHYRETLQHPAFVDEIMAQFGLNRHAFERILFLFPIVLAGFLFSWKGSLITSIAVLACMLPRVLLYSEHVADSIFETAAVFIIGNIVALSFVSLRKEREHRIRLSVLDKIATAVSQSLDLSQVLKASADNVTDVMSIDAALIFLVDEEAGELDLVCYKGVSESFVQGVEKLKLGEGMNGAVALTAKPEYIEDAMNDPRVTRLEAIRYEGLRSHYIVPLMSKGKVMGTLSLATRDKYQFKKEEIETAIAIGNQIGVAIDNARSYEKERKMAEKLRASEERYRNLFENAHDAIMLHDMEGNIINANRASTRLTGYSLEEFLKLKARDFLSPDSIMTSNIMRQYLLQEPDKGYISEMKLIRKDKTEVIVQLSSSLIMDNGQPWAFQHIARDITQERRMQENMRFYLEQVTQAQEDERKRIARELHDETIQSLVVLARKIDEIIYSKNLDENNKRLLESLRDETNSIMAGIRRLSQDLRPPTLDRLGLIPALEWLATNVEDISGIPVKLKIEGEERRLSAEVELILYRIIQEALRNMWRHSKATQSEVVIEFDTKKTKVTIRDNGKGLDFTCPAEELARYGKLGLAGIKERARLLGGTMSIESQPGLGTTINVEVPV